jgi:RNA polymerase sigma factor (sigma-70 family)
MDPADHELLARWQAGEQRAGEQLFKRHFARLYGFFRTKLHDDADELVQATFLACLGAKDRFRGEATFKTFLYGIAKNQLYAALRKRHRDGDKLAFDVSSIAELVSTPRTVIARGQDHARLVAALQRMPIEQQTLLELHYWDDTSISELAAIFEAPEVTIRSRLHRARLALREELQAKTVEDMDDWARTSAHRDAG